MRFNLFSTALFVLGLMGLNSCESSGSKSDYIKESMGVINQVTVFADEEFYKQTIQPALLDSLAFGQPYEGIFYPPEFSFYPRQFPYDLFKGYNNLRNIIYVQKGEPSVQIFEDSLAKPQAFVLLTANSPADYQRLIKENADSMLKLFKRKDREFLVKEYSGSYGKMGTPETEKVGFKMLIPNDYKLVKSENDLVWYRADYPSDILNIMVYKAPAKQNMSLDDILQLRNLTLKQNTKGSKKGDFVQTEPLFKTFVSDSLRTERGLELTVRGNWSMAMDQLGGPSVMKVIINQKTNEIWIVDAFIFAPLKNNKSKKRDYLTQIESFISTFEFL